MIFNKYIFITFLFVVAFLVISVLVKNEVNSFAVYEANSKLDRVLTNQKALHTYVENELKPVIYKLKDENKLYKEFFDPKVLSFTYIARSIYEIENDLYKKAGKSELYYKLAANNPRNDLNKATEAEKKLVNEFNNDRTKKEFKDIIEIDNEKYLYFAKPVGANKESCLKCHSKPTLAPKELVEMYGDIKGFHEELDDIRAMLSIRIPLASELKHDSQYYKKLLIIISLSLLVVYFIIIYLLRSLDKKNKTLYELSTIDQLTQLFNRREFDKDLHASVIEAKRKQSELFLIMLDIDLFKQINDTYGHQVGDEVLVEITNIIRKFTREYEKSYRIGGEEFMILVKDTNKDEILALANRIKNGVEDYYTQDKKVTISIGISKYNNEDDVREFYKKVDDTLYKAKEKGRNRVIIFD